MAKQNLKTSACKTSRVATAMERIWAPLLSPLLIVMIAFGSFSLKNLAWAEGGSDAKAESTKDRSEALIVKTGYVIPDKNGKPQNFEVWVVETETDEQVENVRREFAKITEETQAIAKSKGMKRLPVTMHVLKEVELDAYRAPQGSSSNDDEEREAAKNTEELKRISESAGAGGKFTLEPVNKSDLADFDKIFTQGLVKEKEEYRTKVKKTWAIRRGFTNFGLPFAISIVAATAAGYLSAPLSVMAFSFMAGGGLSFLFGWYTELFNSYLDSSFVRQYQHKLYAKKRALNPDWQPSAAMEAAFKYGILAESILGRWFTIELLFGTLIVVAKIAFYGLMKEGFPIGEQFFPIPELTSIQIDSMQHFYEALKDQAPGVFWGSVLALVQAFWDVAIARDTRLAQPENEPGSREELELHKEEILKSRVLGTIGSVASVTAFSIFSSAFFEGSDIVSYIIFGTLGASGIAYLIALENEAFGDFLKKAKTNVTNAFSNCGRFLKKTFGFGSKADKTGKAGKDTKGDLGRADSPFPHSFVWV